MLQKISVWNKCGSFEIYFHQIILKKKNPQNIKYQKSFFSINTSIVLIIKNWAPITFHNYFKIDYFKMLLFFIK